MNREPQIDSTLRAWLSEGAERAPEWAVWGAIDEVERTAQRPAWRTRIDAVEQRLAPARLLAAAAAIVLLVVPFALIANLSPGVAPGDGRLAPEDLETIVVWQDTMPAGWTLDSLTTTTDDVLVIPVRTMSREQFAAQPSMTGYQAGRYTDFSAPDAVFISWATLYDLPTRADSALDAFARELAAADGWGLGPGQPIALGDGGWVFTGQTQALVAGGAGDPVPMQIYLWRTRNVVLAAAGWFSYDPAELLGVAEGMEARAR